jgi:hypothetical protein
LPLQSTVRERCLSAHQVFQSEGEGKGVSPRRHGEGKEADLGFQALDAFAEKLSSEAAVPF